MREEREAAAIVIADIEASLRAYRPLIYGVSGAQGCGKSTIVAKAGAHLRGKGLVVGILSIDDLYFDRTERRRRAALSHPLLMTRGPPGTHDAALGASLIDAAKRGSPFALPRFDKARDERAPASANDAYAASPDILLIEGWCLGAEPETDASLFAPINMLERNFDADARFRRLVNENLARDYLPLFARIDRLCLLRAPNFEIVRRWRAEQERALARQSPTGAGRLSDDEIGFFIQHYERVTRGLIAAAPDRFHLVLDLAEDRSVVNAHTPR